MLPEHHQIEIERIGEYVQRNSCPRRFKLDLDGRKIPRELPFFTRLINPVDPVLQASGSMREAEWEGSLIRAGFNNVASKLSLEGLNVPWDAFTRVLGDARNGELLFAREVEIQGIIGDFLLRGRMDFLILVWEGGKPLLRVVECKASRKDRTYHRIQLSVYLALVRQAASAGELRVAGIRIGPDGVHGTLVRLNEEGKAENILTAPPLNLDVEMEDVRRMLETGGQLSKICHSQLCDLPYQLDGKCDSCVMNVFCLSESARCHSIELLGLSAPMARAIREAGVKDLDSLGSLAPNGDVAEHIRKSPAFTERLDNVIEKAKVRMSTLPGGEGYEVVPLSNSGLGLLPEHVIEGQRLVRCYISVNYDYSENRVAALSAHLTDSPNRLETRWEDRKKVPGTFENGAGSIRGRDIVLYQSEPWIGDYVRDNASEAELISSFFRQLTEGISEISSRNEAPIHLYFWSKGEVTSLLEGCTRCGSGLLGALTNLLGCREPLEQMIYTILQDEVSSRFALGWTGNGLTVASSLKWFGRRYHWTRLVDGEPVDMDKVFRPGLFDFVEMLPLGPDNNWATRESRDGGNVRFEVRSRFNESLPMPYLHAVWGTLPSPDSLGIGVRVQQLLRQYHAAARPSLLKEMLRARTHALRWVEESIIQKNKFLRKAPLDVASLERFDLQVNDPTRAATDLLRLDHHVQKNDWITRMRLPPRDRFLTGEMIPLHRVMMISEKNEKGYDNDFLLGFVEVERYGSTIADFRNRLTIEVGATVRITAYDGDINEVQSLNDLLYHGGNGIIESFDPDDGFFRIAILGAPSSRYVMLHDSRFCEGSLFTMDTNPSDFVANRADGWLSSHGGSHAEKWFDLSHPKVPVVEPFPESAHRLLKKALSGVSLDGNRLGEDQTNAVLDGLKARIQLLQGPPGTGKTVTTALATLARAHLRGEGGITIVAANTHYAIDRFMEEFEGRKEVMAAALADSGITPSKIAVYHVGKDLDRWNAAALMTSSSNKHLVIGGTINDILKFAQYSERNYAEGRILRPFEADTLVIDEASMMAFPYLMALSTILRQDGRLMLSGDHRQLSPILKHDWEAEDRPPVIKYHPHYSAYDAVASIAESISDAKGKVIRSALDTTYRLPWEVREIISGIYRDDGIVLSGVKRQKERSLIRGEDIWSTVWQDGGVFLMVHDEDRSKNFNEFEAELIEKVLSAGALEERSVAVMTPHRAQRTLLKDRLARFIDKVDIIDTVEKLQGGERPTIVVSGTQSDPSSIANTADFILNLNRSNVIFSRAKERLVVVCSRSLLSSVPADTKQYQTARLWKRLRDFCGLSLMSIDLDGHRVELFTHAPEERIESGEVVDVIEVGEAQEQVPAYTEAEVHDEAIHKRGATPGMLDKFLGPPPIHEIVVDGSNAAWEGRSNEGPSGEQLITCYRDLKEIYRFSDVYILVGPGLRHKMGSEEYDSTVAWFDEESKKAGKKVFHEAPGGAYDDRFTIGFAVNDDLLILTNDRYRDLLEHDEALKNEVRTRTVRYTFMNGRLRIGEWPSYWAF